ncbi:MAG: hypothetical protein WC829_15730 [Hyphomicrobium sp.]|jgi:hypothetical protein
MSGAALKAFRVQLHRRGGKFKGHVDVQATCEKHAERVAVAQVIEVSFPKSKPGQWVVDLVTAKGGEV